MKKVVAMTLHRRDAETIAAVFAGMSLPGNRPDEIVVCYDRSDGASVDCFEREADLMDIPLRAARLSGAYEGPRCPSAAWNATLALAGGSHAFAMSSDVVLGPRSLDMAYHLSAALPRHVIVARAEHCGPSYRWQIGGAQPTRTMTSSLAQRPLGFAWLLPMAVVMAAGGYDEAYMGGLCYDDDDFFIRMWRAGADFLFCDDILAIHLEHRRDHLLNRDGRVTINEKIFVEKYGDVDYAKRAEFVTHRYRLGVGMVMWSHEADETAMKAAVEAQASFGLAEPWRAIR